MAVMFIDEEVRATYFGHKSSDTRDKSMKPSGWEDVLIYRVYQNDWSGFELDYIHKYGEQNYKY